MLGAMLGAAFGTHWIPLRWFGLLENGAFGRDFAVDLGRRLAAIPPRSVVCDSVFALQPLCHLIGRAKAVIASRFGFRPGDDIVECYSPALLKKVDEVALWSEIFCAVAVDGLVRYDIAVSLCAYFREAFAGPCVEIARDKTAFDERAWTALREKVLIAM